MAQKITLADVVRCGRDYLNAHRLTAQKNYKNGQGALGCVYSDGLDGRCIIGSAMSEETINTLRETKHMDERVTTIAYRYKIIEASVDELDVMNDLQSLHDCWTQYSYADRSHVCTRSVMGKLFEANADGMQAALDYVEEMYTLKRTFNINN